MSKEQTCEDGVIMTILQTRVLRLSGLPEITQIRNRDEILSPATTCFTTPIKRPYRCKERSSIQSRQTLVYLLRSESSCSMRLHIWNSVGVGFKWQIPVPSRPPLHVLQSWGGVGSGVGGSVTESSYYHRSTMEVLSRVVSAFWL